MRILIVLAILLLSVSPVQAEWSAELYGGGAFTNKATITDTSTLGLTVTLKEVKFNSSGTVGGRVGYWFNEVADRGAFGLGLDVFHFRADMDQQDVPATVAQFAGTGTIRPVNISVVGIGLDLLKFRLHFSKSKQFPNGQFQPYFSAGPAIFHASISDSSNFTPTNQSQSDTALGVKIGLGLHYAVTPKIGLFGEYRFTHFKAEGSFLDTVAPASTETLKATLNTNHLVGGISFRF